jgi:DNA-binding response OmpR family regulator
MPGSDKSLQGARILVVEDNFLVAEAVCDLLRNKGCVVVGPAPRLERGLRLARDEELDAALLDINLNGERCFPIAEALRSRNVPFIFLTGYDDSIMIPAPLRQAPLLCKPVTDFKLIATLRALLARPVPLSPRKGEGS